MAVRFLANFDFKMRFADLWGLDVDGGAKQFGIQQRTLTADDGFGV